MPILSHPAFGPRTALVYITVGALLDVWTTVWYYSFTRHKDVVSNMEWFLLIGLFLTGVTLIILGVLLGPIGQAARRAELPPSEALRTEAAVQQAASSNPPPMVQAAPAQTVVAAPAPVPGKQVFMGG